MMFISITFVVILMLYLMFKAADLNQWKCVAIKLCWLSFKTPAELHVLAREVSLMKVGFHVYLMPWFAELSVNANGDEEWRFSKEVALLVTSQSDICCLFLHSLHVGQPKVNIYEPEHFLCFHFCIQVKTCCTSYRCEPFLCKCFWATQQTGTWSSQKLT